MEFLFSEVYVYEEIPHESCRESNIELLRVVAMLFVLIVHTDFLVLGFPTPQDMAAAPVRCGRRSDLSFRLWCV